MFLEATRLPQEKIYVRVLPGFPSHYSSQSAAAAAHLCRNGLYQEE
jgi:hypothetical protein